MGLLTGAFDTDALARHLGADPSTPVAVTATIGTLSSEIFSTRVRYTGVTLGYQIGAALAGGTAPLIATWLLSRFDDSWVPIAVYPMFTALISIVAVSLAHRASEAELERAGEEA
ncbi:hypothetical protein GCM10009602_33540 [Nocardiopsis tropica]